MALIYSCAFRRTGLIGYIIILNLLMLLSIPFFGGHYVMEMIGGAAVAVASVLLARTLPARWRCAVKSAIPTVGKLKQSPACGSWVGG
jgi:membrane-associated phospholipid phosphatase